MYREALAGIASWSQAAEAFDRAAAARRSGEENLARCVEISNFALALAPHRNAAQLERLTRERLKLEKDLRAFEAWRERV